MKVLWIIGWKEDGKVTKMEVLIRRSGKISEGTEAEKEWAMLRIWWKSIPDGTVYIGSIINICQGPEVRINLI